MLVNIGQIPETAGIVNAVHFASTGKVWLVEKVEMINLPSVSALKNQLFEKRRSLH